jgi:hypothetical protein
MPPSVPRSAPAIIRNETDEMACATNALDAIRRVLDGTATEQDVRQETEARYGAESQYYFAVDAALGDPDVRVVAKEKGPEAGVTRIRDSVVSLCLAEMVAEGD